MKPRNRSRPGTIDWKKFIDYYITGVLYPRSALEEVRVLVVICVVVSWVGLYLLSRHRTATQRS
ncbi:DUF2784 family protein [Nocardia sp. NPDC046763]|uniref:DUF2784 family protein n=1 Tax=Nocardia sp. NPDC046763 TaxID=3155256 RepID=UPI0033F10629